MAAKSKVIKQVSSVQLVRDTTAGTPGNTTLTTAAAAGASTITVASITNFGIGDVIRIGAGEDLELVRVHPSTAPTGNTITLESALLKAHVSGEPVVEQTAYDLGDVTSDGVRVSFTGESTDVATANRRLAWATLSGYVDAGASFGLPSVSLYSIATAVGALLTAVTGSGTQVSPRQFVTDGSDFAGDTNMSLIVVGTEFDGTTIVAQLWGVDFDYTGISAAFARGQNAAIPCRVIAGAGGVFSTAAPTWTADTSLTPTKGKAFDALAAAGVFTDAATPAATTLSAQATAGASGFTVTAGTGLAVGDWVRFGSGNTAEIWQLDTINTGTGVGTIRGKFYRTQPSGTVFKKQDQTDVEGVAPEGVALAIGGSVERLRDATKRISIGTRPGAATVSLRIPVIAVTLQNLARALGIPQSAISGGKLPVLPANVGTDTGLNGMYFRGVLLDGTTFLVMAWGPSLDLSSVETAFANSGPAAAVPITGKPSSALAILNW